MGNEITLRRATLEDAGQLSLVGQATFLEAFAGILPAADIYSHCRREHAEEKYTSWLRRADVAIWLAEAAPGHAPVGYLALLPPDLPVADLGPRDLEVKRIYLLHRFQGAGLGRRLMDAAREYAMSQGAARLLLGVYARNSAAVAFYRRLGYEQIGTRTFQVGANRYDDLVFALRLGSTPPR